MLNTKFIEKLKKEHLDRELERRQIISWSSPILHDSKRVIFGLHRGDEDKAAKDLADIESRLKKMEEKFGYKRLVEEGSYKAGAEEYVEAKMLYLAIKGKPLDAIKGIRLSYDSYLGGICDLTGELVRRAINKAAAGDIKEVERVKNIIGDVMASLVEFDFTGYLRTKYDQAKGNLRKIEQINYEIKTKR
jgi:predicted translin family RNA/ssDNA-binding protein